MNKNFFVTNYFTVQQKLNKKIKKINKIEFVELTPVTLNLENDFSRHVRILHCNKIKVNFTFEFSATRIAKGCIHLRCKLKLTNPYKNFCHIPIYQPPNILHS